MTGQTRSILWIGQKNLSWDGSKFATPYLLPDAVATDLNRASRLTMILFVGRHDWNVHSEIAAAWFDKLKALERHLVWFQHSGHMPTTEDPGKLFLSLMRFARPIAEEPGQMGFIRSSAVASAGAM